MSDKPEKFGDKEINLTIFKDAMKEFFRPLVEIYKYMARTNRPSSSDKFNARMERSAETKRKFEEIRKTRYSTQQMKAVMSSKATRDACVHKWEEKSSQEITTINSNGTEQTTGTFIILKCKKCGDLKNHRFSVRD